MSLVDGGKLQDKIEDMAGTFNMFSICSERLQHRRAYDLLFFKYVLILVTVWLNSI